jgi:serine/threonine protein phosphatase PrpC
MVSKVMDPQEAADILVDYSLDNRSTDNLTVIVVQINPGFVKK